MQTCTSPLRGILSQGVSLDSFRASMLCSPSSRCKYCWRWRHSYEERGEVWQGLCGHGTAWSWHVPAPWASWTSTAPRSGHLRPPQILPSAGEAPTTAGPRSPEHPPGPDSPKSSILHSPCLPSARLPIRRKQRGSFMIPSDVVSPPDVEPPPQSAFKWALLQHWDGSERSIC